MLERIREYLVNELEVKPEEVTESASFRDDLGVDSLTLLETAMEFESEYNVEFDAEELAEINTVGDFIKALGAKGIEI